MMIVYDALVKFALLYLPKLQYLCFRGDLNTDLTSLLNAYGYWIDEEIQIQLILKDSGKFHHSSIYLHVGESKKATTFRKMIGPDLPPLRSPLPVITLTQHVAKNLIIGNNFSSPNTDPLRSYQVKGGYPKQFGMVDECNCFLPNSKSDFSHRLSRWFL